MRKLNLTYACLCITLCLYLPARADTFTVTNTATAGPGSLRDAIERASANGTATTDYIYFNISRARSAVIQIPTNNPLPALSSNIIIDGTTQNGPAMGVSDARINVSLEGRANDTKLVYSLFVLEGLENVAIYEFLYGVYMKGCRHITIGEAGKGNLVSGWNKGIYSEYDARFGESSHITIQGNIFGLHFDGISTILAGGGRPGSPTFPATNNYGVAMDRDSKVFIGGEMNGEGNRFNSLVNDIRCSGLYNNLDDSVFIINNILGVDINGGMIDVASGTGIWVQHFNNIRATARNRAVVVIRKNYIAGKSRQTGIRLEDIKSFFAVEQNILGSEENGLPVRETSYGAGIRVVQCDIGMIGNILPGNENIIRYWKQGALVCDRTASIGFRYNSTYCNKKRAIELNNWALYNNPARPKPFVTINVIDQRSGIVQGTSTPFALVDLYFNDNCPSCEGKEHLGDATAGVVQADASGQWTYAGGPIGNRTPVATATDPGGATSEYSAPALYDASKIITPDFCPTSTGGICGLRIISGTQWEWRDQNGNVVGRDTCLTGVQPGRYTLWLSIGPASCEEIYTYTIPDSLLSIDSSIAVAVNHARCGQNNGGICNLSPLNAKRWQWENETGAVISTGLCLVNVPAGRYRLRALNDFCEVVTGYYAINNATPRIDVSGLQITPATCSQNNGSITGIVPLHINYATLQWIDENRHVVGTGSNLVNMPAGRYKLVVIDQAGGCGDSTDYLTIPGSPPFNIDTTAVQIAQATCNFSNGSITGIGLTGATNWQWKEVNTNTVIGATIDLINIPAGSYQLLAGNTTYGCTAQSPVYHVPATGPAAIAIGQVTASNATCNNNNGSITIHQFSPDPALFTLRWLLDSVSAIGSTLSLTNLSPATYHLVATDTNGCEQAIYKRVIVMQPLPILHETNALAKPDTCEFGAGSITGLVATSAAGSISYEWFTSTHTPVGNFANAHNLAQGTYYLVIKDVNGCTLKSRDYIVGQVQKTLPTPHYEDLIIPRNTIARLMVTNPLAGGTYELYDAVSGALLDRNTTGQFSLAAVAADRQLEVKVQAGTCSSAAGKVHIKVLDITALEIPNVFSPNGDGINDEFRIRVTGYFLLNQLTIYNRWGQPVFRSRDINLAWNGRLRGSSLPAGAYYYIIEGLDVFGKPLKQAGNVTLVR
jgi:gliding motility-associated-like protein